MSEPIKLTAARNALGNIGGAEMERQIFLCAMSEKQKCCSRAEGEQSWNFLKSRLKELGLVGPKKRDQQGGVCGGIQRSKVDCLQICTSGPIALIWPDRIWYHSCTPEVLEQIIQQHVIGGNPVEEFRLRPAD